MIRLFGGATLLFSAIAAHAGLIAADAPGYGSLDAAYPLDGSDGLSNDSGWDSGEDWQNPDRTIKALPLPVHDHVDIQGFDLGFLPGPPAGDATPVPAPATLALFGLGAGALCLARQGKRA